MTPKQKAIVAFIQKFHLEQGYGPSQREIADYFGFRSLGTVQNYLVRLASSGVLQKTWNGKRSLLVAEDKMSRPHIASALGNVKNVSGADSSEFETGLSSCTSSIGAPVATLPVLGRVAAGCPIQAAARKETLDVPLSLLGAKAAAKLSNSFALQVQGDSMIEEGIFDQDWVVVHSQATAEQGQIVVVEWNHEATIKRWFLHGETIELRSSNPKYKPILIPADDPNVFIRGLLVGLMRSYPV